jgi:hypothetical protein
VVATVSGESIQYRWGRTPALSVEIFVLHFAAEKSFVAFRKVIREIEISQWANVAIEEHNEV